MKPIKNNKKLINFLIDKMPSSNIFYKNLDGTILWHSINNVDDITINKPDINLIGKTVFDFYSKESAAECHELDMETIKIKNITNKIVNLSLLSGEVIQELIIKKPCFNNKNIPSGILVKCINLSKLNNHISNPLNQNFFFLTQELTNDYELLNQFKGKIKEILMLSYMLKLNNHPLQDKLKDFIKSYIEYYNSILSKFSKQ